VFLEERLKTAETTLGGRGISDYYKIYDNTFVTAVHIPKGIIIVTTYSPFLEFQ
jgi:hypothetical protein